MGFWDFLKPSSPPSVGVMSPRVEYVGGPEWAEMVISHLQGIESATPAQMWRTQPHLRTVVSFLARNIAQLGLHVYERVGETDRRRDRTSPLARALLAPDANMTAYELVFALVGDKALYDRAYWLIGEIDGAVRLRRLPPTWVSENAPAVFEVESYRIWNGSRSVDVPAERILAFPGYAPAAPMGASPTIEALRQTLQEQVEAALYRAQVWKRGGRVSAVLQRPRDAPAWSPEAREKFREDWYAKYTGRGARAGGTPILEDGMTLNRVDFNAQEQQFVEAAKLSLSTVAAAFHVNPTMVGQLENANYSNVREFRKMLYGDTLGPLIAEIEQRINTFLLPRLGMDNATSYVEFNIAEKLQGNFEEQSAAMQTATGAPWMTRNEARARVNLPAIDGGDSLVTPLNVLAGGQASPTDSGAQNRNSAEPELKSGRPSLKAGFTDAQQQKVAQVLDAFFARQGKSVLSAIGAGGDWWDEKRWNGELADDLARMSHTLAAIIGKSAAEALGYDADSYDPDMTVHFFAAVAADRAAGINDTTKAQLAEAIDAEDGDPASVFETARNDRGPKAAHAIASFAAGFATAEAARQISKAHGGRYVKTWRTGPNARPEHARMDGETVAVDEKFSNGMDHPGQGGPDDAGCNCSITISQEAS